MLEDRNVVKKDIAVWYFGDTAETPTSPVLQRVNLKLVPSRAFQCLAAEGRITKAVLRDEVPCVRAQENEESACPGFRAGSTICGRPCRKLMGNTVKRDTCKTPSLLRYGHRIIHR